VADTRPLLSVIITSYTADRLNDVCALLDSMKVQSHPNLETIFVAEGSRQLHDQARRYGEKTSIRNFVVLLNDGEPGASAARNLGVQHAEGDIIAFLDDDVVAAPDWAEELVRTYLEDDSVVGVAGSAEPLWEDSRMDWFPVELYWIFGCTGWMGWEATTETGHAPTMNASYRREALEMAGLFSTVLGLQRGKWSEALTKWREVGGEDGELSMRVRRVTGKRIVFNPKVRVSHKVPKSKLALGAIAQRSWAVGRERQMFRKLFSSEERKVIYGEFSLLRRILTRLLPDIFTGFSKDPVIAWRRLQVMGVSLCFAGLGFCTFPFFHNPLRQKGLPVERLTEGGRGGR
jgi:cellulose synthase/poly-beta-1,6-N-acetylglucosamine synthase-like glycosyltransferase